MNTLSMIKIAASSLALVTALAPLAAANSVPESSVSAKTAASAAQQATKLLEKRKFAAAIAKAEDAVAAMPRNAEYRALLGQAYLSGGRFASAETTLGEAAALDPANARSGLNLALAQITNGHNDRALATLDTYRERLTAADFGLAVALAGDLEGAVSILEAAVRVPESDAKTRQNLALTYALSNRWREARIMANQDLAGEVLYARLTEWAAMTNPSSASQQVATLLRVTPVFDPGQPQQLALVGAPEQQVAVAAPVPEPVAPPVASFSSAPAPVFEVAEKGPAPEVVPYSAPAPAPVVVALAEPAPSPVAGSNFIWGPRNPVVQAIHDAPLIRSAPKPLKLIALRTEGSAAFQPLRPYRLAKPGQFVVQLAAFANASGARDAWQIAAGRAPILTNFRPSTTRIQLRGATFYRLSVSGFGNRETANQLCAQIKSSGGDCFVRTVAGDTPLQWTSPPNGSKIASR